MRRNIDGTCSPSCCSNPNIRTINTMGADTQGNFTIRGDQGIHVTVGTNEIIISGIAVYYDNLDGNLVIDNDAMTIDLADDISIAGDMIIAGDLTVNGTYYTVHAEHVYTEDDYIIMRNGAVTGLGSGQYSGFQVTKYDGTNDGRLVIDNSGTARVGDVGDEQPLLTRDESADLTDGDSLIWDAANSKAVTAAIPSAISTALGGKQDTLHPYRYLASSGKFTIDGTYANDNIAVETYGRVCTIKYESFRILSAMTGQVIGTGFPKAKADTYAAINAWNSGYKGFVGVRVDGTLYAFCTGDTGTAIFDSLTYIIDESETNYPL